MAFSTISRDDLIVKTATWLDQVKNGNTDPPEKEVSAAWRDLTSREFEDVYRQARNLSGLVIGDVANA